MVEAAGRWWREVEGSIGRWKVMEAVGYGGGMWSVVEAGGEWWRQVEDG